VQLQVPTWRRTLLIIKKKVKKQLYFDDFQTFSPTPGVSAPDVTHYNISDQFWFRWTQNTPRIPKMYSFMGIWAIPEELLTSKVTATLRRKKWKKKRRKGKGKNIWQSHVFKNDGRVNERIYDKVIYSTNKSKNKRRKGKSKNIWQNSYIQQTNNRRKAKSKNIWLKSNIQQEATSRSRI